MFRILIVDDEPMICKGLSNLVQHSGLHITQTFIANNGYEALDYLRIEDIDLLITDIQMGEMNGIELMQQAKIIKPWIETIIISAHEDFQYAQKAIRLGAKDYLIKPLNMQYFLDTVRNVLLNHKKSPSFSKGSIYRFTEDFFVKEPSEVVTSQLNQLLSDSTDPSLLATELSKLPEGYQIEREDSYFSMIKVKLNLEASKGQVKPYRYAAFNIVCETLEKECNYISFYSDTSELEISVILQWSEQEFLDIQLNKISYLEMIGRTINFNIAQYLDIECLVGISQVLKGAEFLQELYKQAEKAISWNRDYHDNHVFYYGDLNWGFHNVELSSAELAEQKNSIVTKVKDYIDENYGQKGLTLISIAQENHVSPNYLSYLFKKHTSYNLWEYVTKLRMEESKRLILNTDLRRYEISEKVGYESPEHFSKLFKKYFGKNLSEMKK